MIEQSAVATDAEVEEAARYFSVLKPKSSVRGNRNSGSEIPTGRNRE
jgi:hypothetical protein